MSIRDWAILDRQYKEVRHKPYTPKRLEASRTFQLPKARDITLAEYDPSSQGLITAHRIRDYRRRHFSLVLLPEIEIEADAYTAPLEVSDSAVL